MCFVLVSFLLEIETAGGKTSSKMKFADAGKEEERQREKKKIKEKLREVAPDAANTFPKAPFSYSNYRPLLGEPQEILFLRLRLLFFLKYSFYYNPQSIYPLFFGKKEKVEGKTEEKKQDVNERISLVNSEAAESEGLPQTVPEIVDRHSEDVTLSEGEAELTVIPKAIGEEDSSNKSGGEADKSADFRKEAVGVSPDASLLERIAGVGSSTVSGNVVSSTSNEAMASSPAVSKAGQGNTLASFIRSLAFESVLSSADSLSESKLDSLPLLLAPFLFDHPYEFVEEKVILLGKMRRHFQALELLVGVAGDLQVFFFFF
jgi:hypothetical protein